jgi:tetratricopeptide (TPR) repeat protein
VPPFVIWPAWAMAGLIEDPSWRRPIRIGLIVVGIPLTILSGSRSAWLAIAVTALLAGVPWLWSRRDRIGAGARLRGRRLLLAFGGVAAAALLAALVIPRLTAFTSLLYRVELWRDTLRAWSTDPLLGIGPGFMPYARQAAAADLTFPVRQPHSHNVPLGILGDAGLIGLLAATALVVALAVVAHPWRTRSPAARTASVVLVGLAIGSLAEDLTFLPNFNLLAITLVAVVLLDVGAVRWSPLPRPAIRRIAVLGPASAIGIVLLVAMAVADAGALTYRIGLDAAADRRWPAAVTWFELSAAIDPWHPSTPKSLAIVADAAGDDSLARDAAERALARNPGDGASWLNLSLACAALDDGACRDTALERTVATASLGGPETANAALGYEELGLQDAADEAFRRAILSQRLTTLAIDWPRRIPIGEATLGEAEIGADADLNRLLGQWAMGEAIDPMTFAEPRARALAYAVLGDEAEADAWLDRAIAESPDVPRTWELAVVLREHWGRSTERELRIAEVVRGGPFPARGPSDVLPTITWDIASFRGWPIDGLLLEADRVRPDPTFPWALEAVLP